MTPDSLVGTVMTKVDVRGFPSADWQITTRCNMVCGFCFGSERSAELNTEQAKIVLDNLVQSGFKSIGFTGGEPLIRRDIDELLKHAYLGNLELVLSTNGTLLFEHLEPINLYVDWLGLPLDGYNPNTNDSMRSLPGHFAKMMKILDLIRDKTLLPKIKIGTVVSKLNVNHVEGIGSILEDVPIQTWKLYQFTPLERGRENKELFTLQDAVFEEISNRVRERFPKLHIVVSSIKDREGSYFLIKPDGSVVTPYGEQYLTIGNILRTSAKVILLHPHIRQAFHFKNFVDTYSVGERM